jgi:hypothetical protein
MKRISFLSIVFLLATRFAFADIIIGNPITSTSNFSVNIQLFAPTGQSFIADRSVLKSVGMWTSTCSCLPLITFQLSLLRGSGTSGAVLATRQAVAPQGLYGFLNLDFSGVAVTVGQTYTAVMTQITPNPPNSAGFAIYGTPNDYPGGIAFIKASPRPDLEFALRVIDDPLAAAAREYPAKFVCGAPDTDLAHNGQGLVAAGQYFATVNVHNPADVTAVLKVKVATAGTDAKSAGFVSSFTYMQLGADQVQKFDCDDIRSLAKNPQSGKEPSGLLDGFLVIITDFDLDVDTVYTGAQNGQLKTFDIQRVPERNLSSLPQQTFGNTPGKAP